jgi:hypothetical protein
MKYKKKKTLDSSNGIGDSHENELSESMNIEY